MPPNSSLERRAHPFKPSVKYSVEAKGVFTSVSRLGQRNLFKEFVNGSKRQLRQLKRWWPFMIRFIREIIDIGGWRLWLHLATTIVKGLLPAFELWLSTQLIQLVQDAIQKRTMSRSRLLVLSICKLASSYASEVIESLTADSSGELHHRVNTHVELKTMQACQGLDLVTLQRATTRKDLQAAAHLGSDSYEFVPATMAKLVSSIIGFIGQAAVAKRLAKDVGRVTGMTDETLQRARTMWSMSKTTQANWAEVKTLGLGAWVVDEYTKATQKLGEVNTTKPRDEDIVERASDLLNVITEVGIYAVFALRESRSTTHSAIGSAEAMATFTLMQRTSSSLSYSLLNALHNAQRLVQQADRIRRFYRLRETKSLLEEPIDLASFPRISEKGMSIEFQDVHFKYPGPKADAKAIKGLSFSIQPGEVVAIVGENGCGKSTLVNLLARLYDVGSGAVFLNGVDVRRYKASDVHRNMQILWQTAAKFDLSIAEFIAAGDLATADEAKYAPTTDTDVRIRAAAEQSGALAVIEKKKDGFAAKIGPYPPHDTVESLLKEAWENDDADSETSSVAADDDDNDDEEASSGAEQKEDEHEAGEGEDGADKTSEEAREASANSSPETTASSTFDSVSTTTTATSVDSKATESDTVKAEKQKQRKQRKKAYEPDVPLVFSGGEWQKVVMSRIFLKPAQLLVLDEFSAALDPVAEHELFEKLVTERRGKATIIYVTHRVHMATRADRIIVLKDGKVAENGTHAELMTIPDGQYRKSYEVQAANFAQAETAAAAEGAPTPLNASTHA